jgi:glycogen operon protein
MRCNPHKLLVDPYARRISGTMTDMEAALGYADDPEGVEPSTVDSLGHVPLSVVTSPGGPDTGIKPDVPFEETVIYELHVKGFTQQHPDLPEALRGTYLGLAHPAVIEHLVRLGVTTVELLPVQAFSDEPSLVRAGRHNYWGYSPLGFFAPHAAYASEPGREVEEFRTMVAALHAAGIEVIIDVVYNHTCEGGPDGPTLSFRGYEAPAYYLHDENGHMADITGCGNTLEAGSATVVRMVTDSLRYWATELGVDGFRFDLASALGRARGGTFDRDSTLLTAITTDPVLSRCKLIAEPWDATGEGYKVGYFGAQWAEWNGIYRDTVRDFWRGAAGGVDGLAYRLSGSSDLYDHTLRRPWQSINFVTAHDGFTLRDLVSYDAKHNDANGEDNRDGTDDNRSWNSGVEGDTDDPGVMQLRTRQARNLFATLMLSTGTPMFVGGDERWRTQLGNNNAYCLDDPTSWVDWTVTDEADAMLGFARKVIFLRANSPALRQPEFFDGRTTPTGRPDLIWLRPDGVELTEADWLDEDRHFLGRWIDGSNSQSRTRDGELVQDHSWLLLMHAGADPIEVTLPSEEFGTTFEPTLDTTAPDGEPATVEPLSAGSSLTMQGRSLLLLKAPRGD